MYTISDLERVSYIKVHTIRIWEKRYSLLSPQRTKGNHRFYSDADLVRLINVCRMVSSGFRISVVVKWHENEMTERISNLRERIGETVSEQTFFRDEIFASAIEYNEQRFINAFDAIDTKYNCNEVWNDYLEPAIHRIRKIWITKKIKPTQEHFLSQLIIRKIGQKIDQLPITPSNAKSFLLFQPVGELDELDLQLSHYCIKKSGFKAIYLGGNVPVKNIEQFLKNDKSYSLFIHINGMKITKSFTKFLQKTDQFDCEKILVGRLDKNGAEQLRLCTNAIFLESIRDVHAYLQSASV